MSRPTRKDYDRFFESLIGSSASLRRSAHKKDATMADNNDSEPEAYVPLPGGRSIAVGAPGDYYSRIVSDATDAAMRLLNAQLITERQKIIAEVTAAMRRERTNAPNR